MTLNFFLPRLLPGDPSTRLFARLQGRLAPEAMDALRDAFGLNDAPLLVQYFTYIREVFQGNFGISIAYFPTPVTEVIAKGLPWTLFLAGSAVVVSFVLGTALGAITAWWRRSWVDSVLPSTLILIGSFPYFWLAMFALYLLGFVLGWFPLGHAYGDDLEPGFSWLFITDVIRHSALPVATLVLATWGGWLLTMRNTMITVMGSDFVGLAEAKGLPTRKVLTRYAARNALLPSVTGFGMALGFVLGGSLLTEIVFAYPGQGYLLVQAVKSQDYALMQGIFLIITFSVLTANWFVDLLYLWLDPRTRGAR